MQVRLQGFFYLSHLLLPSISHLQLSSNDYFIVMDMECQNDHTQTDLLGLHALFETTC